MTALQAWSLLPLAGTMTIAMFPALIIYHYVKIFFLILITKINKYIKWKFFRWNIFKWIVFAAGILIWAAIHDFVTTLEYMVITSMHWSNNLFYILTPAIIIILVIEAIIYALISQHWVKIRIHMASTYN